jgi:hypothetical protein
VERVYVPEHQAQPAGKVRTTIGALLAGLGLWLWRWLPGRIQGALCGCPICRGEVMPPASAP